eukprot:NODE_177_length_15815_cov_0.395457.p5 type:complete len:380 gc:universal NODE_177_length_15815_cov_0.395457:12104-10965(-)
MKYAKPTFKVKVSSFLIMDILFLLPVIMGVSIDCPKVIDLAYGMNMHIVNPSYMNQLKSDCCANTYVFCNSVNVLEINWKDFSLNGYINGSSLPSLLNKIDFSRNSLVGEIPSNLPSSLKLLFLNSNLLNGTIPSTLPEGLTQLYISENSLFGTLPYQLPTTLTTLTMSYNELNGILYITKPFRLYAKYNLITDVLITDTTSLKFCDLSYTPLLNSSNIASLTTCVLEGIYDPANIAKPNRSESISTISFSEVSTNSESENYVPTISSKVFGNLRTSTFKGSKSVIKTTASTLSLFTPIAAQSGTQFYFNSEMKLNYQTVNFSQAKKFRLSFSPTYVVTMIIKLVIDTILLSTIFNKTKFRNTGVNATSFKNLNLEMKS